MKKALRIILRIVAIAVVVILLAAIIIPAVFKDQIKEKVVKTANEKVNAEIAIGDFSLTVLRNFPNLTFRLKEVSVTGIDNFEGDTLAGFQSFNLVFDIASVFSGSGYRVRAIDIDRPVASAIILDNGTANYDIMPAGEEQATGEPEEETGEEQEEEGKDIAFRLNRFSINNATLSYTDMTSGMDAAINGLDLLLSGDMAENITNLLLEIDIQEVDFILDGLKLVNGAEIETEFDIEADLENNEFSLGDNYIMINALKLLFSGSLKMEDEDIITDLQINTGDTEFKSVLSMVPAVYMKGFEGLETEGSFDIDGRVKGRYSAADSLLPDIEIGLTVSNGMISYPDLPERISNINISTRVDVDGTNPDNTSLDLEKFHFELKGSPFDMTAGIRTPLSDPAVKASFNGSLDLAALAGAVPIEIDDLAGVLDLALDVDARKSMIDNMDYDNVEANGSLALSEFNFIKKGLPPVGIKIADFTFAPDHASLNELKVSVAGNDIEIDGRLENYLDYILADGTVKGKLNLYSAKINMDTIFHYMPVDTTQSEQEGDSLDISTPLLPANIDFEFTSLVDEFYYSPLEAHEVKGQIALKDRVLTIENTGLKTLGGSVTVNAEFNTSDTLKPELFASLNVNDIGIKETFETFNTVRKIAPVAKGMDGSVSTDFDFRSLLAKDMTPVINTINGSGRLQSESIQFVSSPVYEKMSALLQFGEDFTNEFRDVDVYFEVRDGRVFIKPFDTEMGAMNVNVSGDHGIDQTINYLLKIEVPSEDLPGSMSSVLTGLAAKAALLGIEYYQPEIIKMNVSVGGTVTEPVIRPSLGGTGAGETVKEAAKETVEKVVKEKVEETKEKVSGEAGEQADRILAEAQQQADRIKAEAAKAAEKIREEGDRNAQKLIDNAESKGALAKIAAERAAEALRKEADKKATQLEEEAAEEADKIMAKAREKADDLLEK